jgi:hypothetical protein
MRRRFPQFTYQRAKGSPTWIGTLQPDPDFPLYLVKVTFCPPKAPRVYVIAPPLRHDAPHHYADGSLCLYYPPDGSWSCRRFIADTIVPWAAYWLVCYTLWVPTGEWFGPEAPHARRKRLN